jgi:predicted nucleic acid-binding protein
MIAVDTNVLIGAIQTFDLQLRATARRAVKSLFRQGDEIFPTSRKLVIEHRVSGIQVHDARIVAAMSVHQVNKILSFDLDDLTRYPGIAVVHPTDVK